MPDLLIESAQQLWNCPRVLLKINNDDQRWIISHEHSQRTLIQPAMRILYCRYVYETDLQTLGSVSGLWFSCPVAFCPSQLWTCPAAGIAWRKTQTSEVCGQTRQSRHTWASCHRTLELDSSTATYSRVVNNLNTFLTRDTRLDMFESRASSVKLPLSGTVVVWTGSLTIHSGLSIATNMALATKTSLAIAKLWPGPGFSKPD